MGPAYRLDPDVAPSSGLFWMPRVKPGHEARSNRCLTSQGPITLLHLLRIEIDVATHLLELRTHPGHAVFDSALHRHAHRGRIVQRGGVVAHVLGDLHRAELWAAHRAEMRDLVRFL